MTHKPCSICGDTSERPFHPLPTKPVCASCASKVGYIALQLGSLLAMGWGSRKRKPKPEVTQGVVTDATPRLGHGLLSDTWSGSPTHPYSEPE